MLDFVQVRNLDPFQVIIYKVRDGEGPQFAQRLKNVLNSAEGTFEVEVISSGTMDELINQANELDQARKAKNQSPSNDPNPDPDPMVA